MMTQNEVRNKRKQQEKEKQMKIYLELQTKKLDMEAVKKRKLDMEESIQTKKLAIEESNADTKANEVVLEIMIMDLTNMSLKRWSWLEKQKKDMFDQDDMN
ncbi:Receptor-like protein kinase HSL1 [Hordeum vulgare]|nr:Receptor-like protein kinase HSL1 [Hordeum vulgare]